MDGARIELTEQDLIAALVAAQAQGDDPGLTVFELALKTGHSERWVRTKLKLLAYEGRIDVGRRPGEMLDGRPMKVPVYRLKQQN